LSFNLGTYDHTKTIVIDPIVRVFATYYGGMDYDEINSVAVDNLDNIYIVGITDSGTGIATSGSFLPSNAISGDSEKMFFAKFNSCGVREWGTYYDGNVYGDNIAVDNCGDIVIVGSTHIQDNTTITTPNSHQPNYAGGIFDGFVTKFSSNGERKWGTYYGGQGNDFILGVTIDKNGNIAVIGRTYQSNSGIATPGAHQTTLAGSTDAFFAKFDASGKRLWGTYYGGDLAEYGHDITTDTSGNIIGVGQTRSTNNIATIGAHQEIISPNSLDPNGQAFYDIYLVKFNTDGVRQWGTYYGGTEEDEALGIATEINGNILIAGSTRSASGIATADTYQPFLAGVPPPLFTTQGFNGLIAKFKANGTMLWGTYYALNSATATTHLRSIAVDDDGVIFVAGTTNSVGNFFATADGFKTSHLNSDLDVIFATFKPSGSSRLYGSYYGGSADDYKSCLAIATNTLVIGGRTNTFDDPVNDISTPGSHQDQMSSPSDGFLVKFFSPIVKTNNFNFISNNFVTTSVCQSSAISVPYSVGSVFNAGNVFTVQLSDANGSFANPVVIGTLNSNVSGIINANIPINIPSGNGYKIRIVSSNPIAINCLDASVTIGIGPNTISSLASIAGCGSFNPNMITGSTPTFGGNGIYTYQWQLLNANSNNLWVDIPGATTKDYDPPSITETTLYRRNVSSNGCTVSSNQIKYVVNPTIANNLLNAVNLSFCSGANPPVLVGNIPTGGTGTYTYQWESSLNNVNWINASGISNTKDYDPPALNQTTYYRRKVMSGSCSNISNTVKITIILCVSSPEILGEDTFIENNFSLQPNPTNSNILLETQLSDNTSVDLKIINELGEILYTYSENHDAGTFRKTIDVSSFVPGIYLVNLKTAENIFTEKLMISK